MIDLLADCLIDWLFDFLGTPSTIPVPTHLWHIDYYVDFSSVEMALSQLCLRQSNLDSMGQIESILVKSESIECHLLTSNLKLTYLIYQREAPLMLE